MFLFYKMSFATTFKIFILPFYHLQWQNKKLKKARIHHLHTLALHLRSCLFLGKKGPSRKPELLPPKQKQMLQSWIRLLERASICLFLDDKQPNHMHLPYTSKIREMQPCLTELKKLLQPLTVFSIFL